MNLKKLMILKKLAVKKEFLEEISTNETKVEGKPFRLCRKKYFLTYSQCGVLKEQLCDFLLNKFPVENYIISQELHADGNQHLHVYLSFKKKYNVRNPR
ncbi:MAG: Alternanthera yellow vein virus, partial [Bacteroidota bacterium]